MFDFTKPEEEFLEWMVHLDGPFTMVNLRDHYTDESERRVQLISMASHISNGLEQDIIGVTTRITGGDTGTSVNSYEIKPEFFQYWKKSTLPFKERLAEWRKNNPPKDNK